MTVCMTYVARGSTHGLKVYASDIARSNRCCGTCGNRDLTTLGAFVCKIDGHRVGYLDCDLCWCRHWKRNRKFD